MLVTILSFFNSVGLLLSYFVTAKKLLRKRLSAKGTGWKNDKMTKDRGRLPKQKLVLFVNFLAVYAAIY